MQVLILVFVWHSVRLVRVRRRGEGGATILVCVWHSGAMEWASEDDVVEEREGMKGIHALLVRMCAVGTMVMAQ